MTRALTDLECDRPTLRRTDSPGERRVLDLTDPGRAMLKEGSRQRETWVASPTAITSSKPEQSRLANVPIPLCSRDGVAQDVGPTRPPTPERRN